VPDLVTSGNCKELVTTRLAAPREGCPGVRVGIAGNLQMAAYPFGHAGRVEILGGIAYQNVPGRPGWVVSCLSIGRIACDSAIG